MKLTRRDVSALAEKAGVKLPPPVKRANSKGVNPKLFKAACVANGLPEPEAEWLVCDGRKWRMDFFWPWAVSLPMQAVALEVEGAVWTGGRHTSGAGFTKDLAKYNEIALQGILLLRCTPADVKSGAVFPLLRRALLGEE